MSVRLRPQARIDVEELALRLGEDYPRVGVAFLTRFNETVELLEEFPRIGSPAPCPVPAKPDILFVPIKRFRNFLIAYVPLSDGIDIVRVVDGRRDIGNIFGDDFEFTPPDS